jgi:hypothetical protein
VEVAGPTQLKQYYRDPALGQVFQVPLLRWDQPDLYAIDSLKIHDTPGMIGLFFSEDAKSLAINLKHKQSLSKEKCDQLSYDVQRVVADFRFEKNTCHWQSSGTETVRGVDASRTYSVYRIESAAYNCFLGDCFPVGPGVLLFLLWWSWFRSSGHLVS